MKRLAWIALVCAGIAAANSESAEARHFYYGRPFPAVGVYLPPPPVYPVYPVVPPPYAIVPPPYAVPAPVYGPPVYGPRVFYGYGPRWGYRPTVTVGFGVF